jgi:signal transduction histidine kinase
MANQVRLHLQSLVTRITLLVLVVLTLFAMALGLLSFGIMQDWLEKRAIANLEALAAARQVAIALQLAHYFEDMDAFAHPHLEAELAALLAASAPQRAARQAELAAALWRQKQPYPYLQWAMVIDLNGTILATTAAPEEHTVHLGEALTKGRARPFISDPFVEDGTFYLELSGPLHDLHNNTTAVLILRFDAQQLLALTGDYAGLGETGETLVGRRRGDAIYFLTPLRFAPNLAEVKPAKVDEKRAEPMIHATAGQAGVIKAMDYRNEPVIAAYRPLEVTGWGLVVKQDERETLAEATQARTTLLGVIAILLLLSAIITLSLMNTFTRPLRDLEAATGRIAAGDLTVTVPVGAPDEVGRLAEAFNRMVGRLREAYGDLERRNRELTSFAYVVSHDLKTPLRGITSLSEWLEEDLGEKLAPEQQEQMKLLRARVQRMDALINGLLEYSRVGRIQLPNKRVEIAQLISQVIDMLGPPGYIHITVIPPMPTLYANEMRLAQVFQNLLDNAIKYHPGPTGQVEVSCQDGGHSWEFAVRDDGTGIEPRHHERIFQIFQSLQVRDNIQSTGIGLSLVKKIVEEQGGQVWVESEGMPGRGATFRFTWPKEQEK